MGQYPAVGVAAGSQERLQDQVPEALDAQQFQVAASETRYAAPDPAEGRAGEVHAAADGQRQREDQ